MIWVASPVVITLHEVRVVFELQFDLTMEEAILYTPTLGKNKAETADKTLSGLRTSRLDFLASSILDHCRFATKPKQLRPAEIDPIALLLPLSNGEFDSLELRTK